MKAAIINVGTELLMGSTLNTHSQYLSLKLSEMGIPIYYHGVVGDNPDRLREMLRHYFETVDLIILTGGLGPTEDDLTKEIVCEYMGVPLIFSEELHQNLIERFKKYGSRTMTQNNLKQCYIPESGVVLANPNGTAPGCIVSENGKTAILLPGPPNELIPMVDNEMFPYLAKRVKGVLISKYVRLFGIGESACETEVLDLIHLTNPTLATYAKLGEVMLRITASGETEAEAEELLAPVVKEVENRLGQYIYALDNEELEMVLVKALKAADKTIAFAESCTGGMISSRVVNVSGSSAVFGTGIVAYANEAKTKLLGVSEDLLESHGAVSEAVAQAMSEGLFEASGADLCVSVTGVAGPDGGTAEKPVGLVYLDLYMDGHHETHKLQLTGNRDRIRNHTTLHALHKSLLKIWGE